MALPAELCGIICRDSQLTRRDLRVLCAVSRTFRDEAERLLYVTVRLLNFRLVRSWSISLVRRPHLALRVRSLSLTMPPSSSLYPADLSKIHKSLRACSNLQALEVLNDGITYEGDSVQSWILEGHSFRLSKFANTYFHPIRLFRFLAQQSDIRILVLRTSDAADIPYTILPNLNTIDVSANVLRRFVSGYWEGKRPIAHIQYHLSRSSESDHISTFVVLSRFRETLTSLSLHRHGGFDIAIVMATVAVQLPELKFFRFIDDNSFVRYTSSMLCDLVY